MPQLGLIATAAMVAGAVEQTTAGVKAADAHADVARMEADSARESAAYQERQYRRNARFAIGKQIASGASSGFDISGGSPLLNLLDSTQQAELEALNIRRTGETQARGKDYESRLAKASKSGIVFTGATNATSSVLSSWMRRQGPGQG